MSQKRISHQCCKLGELSPNYHAKSTGVALWAQQVIFLGRRLCWTTELTDRLQHYWLTDCSTADWPIAALRTDRLQHCWLTDCSTTDWLTDCSTADWPIAALLTADVYKLFYFAEGRDSSVGIANSYGLDGPGIESRWVAKFSAPVQNDPGAHPASYSGNRFSVPGVKRSGRGVDHPSHLAPRLKKHCSYTSSPSVIFLACSRVNWMYFARTVQQILCYPFRNYVPQRGALQATSACLTSKRSSMPNSTHMTVQSLTDRQTGSPHKEFFYFTS